MAQIYNKFHSFTTRLGGRVDLTSDVLGVMLTNTVPLATNEFNTDITEITAQFGYAAGGPNVTIASWDDSDIAGVAELVTTRPTVTASGGDIGPYRYAVLYDKTTTDLISWFDYGASVSIRDGEAVEVQFDDGSGFGTFRIGA